MLRSLCLILWVASSGPGAAAAPVGMPCRLAGKPEVRAGGIWKPLRLMQPLEPGDVVRCGPGAAAAIVLFDRGKRFEVEAGGEAVVEAGQLKGRRITPLAPLTGTAARVAQGLTGPRIAGFMARPARSHRRLTPQAPGWLTDDRLTFEWSAVAGAATYSFTLFDQQDNVVWSQRVAEPRAEYPPSLPAPTPGRPYVWRMVPFGPSGKPMASGDAWGVITVLSRADADRLVAEEAELQEKARQQPDDTTFLVLQAELYRQYGVLDRALEILEDPRLIGQPGVQEALDEIYRQVSPYAQLLAGRAPSGSQSF
jgi:hypothetical protein